MDAVSRFGGNAMMTPKSCNSGTDRMAYVARKVKADYYVNIQGDEPLMNAAAIKAAVRLALKKKAAATAATTLEKKDFANPNAVKVILDKDARAIYFSRSLIPFDRDGMGKFKWLKHLGLYVYPRQQLFQFVAWPACKLELTEKLEQLRALYNGMPLYVAETKYDSIGVDTPKDLETVKGVIARPEGPWRSHK
jgi:3-deoxy-manno-octulosonate cytidylyltransferase (CMP-KDO synthetase)